MSSNKILSILIPTKNRYEYLCECLRTLKHLDPRKVQIVISDNSDNNEEFLIFLEKEKFKNIDYIHSTEALSQTGNSELALNAAKGDYCLFIGDDDSVSHLAVNVAEYLKRNNIDACVCDVATYHWPDIVYEKKSHPSYTFIKNKLNIKYLDGDKVLKDVLSYGIQDIKFLARVYHGIVKREILIDVKKASGSFYPGPSPDMANAVSCTLLIPQYIYINQPIILSGYSYKSAGGMGLRGQHSGLLSQSKQLDPDVESKWTEGIPKLWLGYTMWMESGLKALSKMGREDLIMKANFDAMFAKIWLRYPLYRSTVHDFIRANKSYVKFIYECVRFMTRWSREKIISKFNNKRKYVEWERISLSQASEILNNYLKIYETKF